MALTHRLPRKRTKFRGYSKHRLKSRLALKTVKIAFEKKISLLFQQSPNKKSRLKKGAWHVFQKGSALDHPVYKRTLIAGHRTEKNHWQIEPGSFRKKHRKTADQKR